MEKLFKHIMKQLISPAITPKHEGGFFNRYLKNRQNMKYCTNIWTSINE